MKSLVLLGVVLVTVLEITSSSLLGGHTVGRDVGPSLHIAGGIEAEENSFPYQVGLDIWRDKVYKHFCGGALLTNEWILTAAHCVKFKSVKVKAILGAHNLTRQEESGRQFHQVEKIVIHPRYDGKTRKNDIALLQVRHVHYTENRVAPIRLPSASQNNWWFWSWPVVTLTGWGSDSETGPDISPVLKSVTSRILPNFYCKLRYLSFFTDCQFLCVSGWGQKGVCSGDDGGPMAIDDKNGRKTLVGIASFNSNSGCERSYPMGFTKVSAYLDWINGKIQV